MDKTDLLAALEARIGQYRSDSAALDRKTAGLRNALSSVLGGKNENKRSPIHLEFYRDMERLVDELLAAPPSAEQAAQGLRILLSPKEKGTNLVQYGWLCAIEPLAIPLVRYAEPEALAPLCESYGKRWPKRERMPRQQELYETMERRLAERGRQGRQGGIRQ